MPPPEVHPLECTVDCVEYDWVAGVDYNGTESGQLANYTIGFIRDQPWHPKDQFYYELISIWDSAGGYDQIGFDDDWGVLNFAYSFSTGTCTDPVYWFDDDAAAVPVSRFADSYRFEIQVVRNEIEFLIGTDASHPDNILNVTAVPGRTVTGLQVTSAYCGAYGYTLYEEAFEWNATKTPVGNFKFGKNWYVDSTGQTFYPTFDPYYDGAPEDLVTMGPAPITPAYNTWFIDNGEDGVPAGPGHSP
jgi:hypothetical protein